MNPEDEIKKVEKRLEILRELDVLIAEFIDKRDALLKRLLGEK